MHTSRLALLASAAAVAVATPVIASAQTANSNQIDTVVVTARKRSEDILKIPVSVSAFSGAALATRGVETLDDLSNFTPGMSDDHASGGSGRADRSFQSIIIRGMNPSTTTRPTTSIFINGTPIASPDMIQNLDDVDHVEVLKGPQSAYFGRSTFAGAVNVVTKAASNTYTGTFSAEAGTRRNRDFVADFSGPIIAEKLSFSIGGKYDAHDGSYKNAYDPGQTLGDQETKSFHVGLTAKPIENLTVKFYGLWLQDNDGPAATGLYLAGGLFPSLNPAGKYNQSNCTINSISFICGTLPSLSAGTPAQDTTLTPALQNFLKTAPGSQIAASDVVKHFGLRRDAQHLDLNAEYVIPSLGLTLTSLSSYNTDNWSELSDLSLIDSTSTGSYPGYGGYPFMVEGTDHDMSQEFRIATDVTKPYRALLGISYVDSHTSQELGTPSATTRLNVTSLTQSKTSGIFFSLAYDILPQLTVNFDGRYQIDDESTYSGATGLVQAEGKAYNFLPRASVQYKFTRDVMGYFTYSKGVNPGTFNSTVANLPAASQAEIHAAGYNVGISVKPELITNYEVGVKGRFFDGRATLSADFYYDKWTQQLDAESYTFLAADPTNPYNIVGQSLYQAGNVSVYPVNFTDNSAASIAKGVEFEANFIPIEHVSVNVSGAWNDTQYTSFICSGCQPYTTFNAKGKYLPNAPLKSLSAGFQYSNTTRAFGESADWFGRLDVVYKDGVWLDSSNTVKTPASKLVNLRAGLNFDSGIGVEAYVYNLFNDKTPTSGFVGYNFPGGFTQNAIDVGLPELITVGVKVKYHF